MQANTLLRTLFDYKAWANDALFTQLRALPDAAHAATRHSATRVLNHVYVVDRIFEANVQGRPHAYTGLNTPETPALDALHDAVRGLDAWYLAYVATLDEASLGESIAFTFVDGKPGRMTRGEMLAHVITHGNYHRGAAGRILVLADQSPPPDTLTVFLHRGDR